MLAGLHPHVIMVAGCHSFDASSFSTACSSVSSSDSCLSSVVQWPWFFVVRFSSSQPYGGMTVTRPILLRSISYQIEAYRTVEVSRSVTHFVPCHCIGFHFGSSGSTPDDNAPDTTAGVLRIVRRFSQFQSRLSIVSPSPPAVVSDFSLCLPSRNSVGQIFVAIFRCLNRTPLS